MFFILLLLALAGFSNTLYLLYIHLAGAVPACTEGFSCSEVLTSSYATLWGFPVAFWGGLLFWVLLAVILRLKNPAERPFRLRWIQLIVGFGFIESLRLTWLSVFVLKALCLFCLINLGIWTALLILSLAWGWSLKNWVGKYPWERVKLHGFQALIALAIGVFLYSSTELMIKLQQTQDFIVAKVDGNAIKLKDVDRKIRSDLYGLELKKYQLRKNEIDQQVLEAEAAQKKCTVKALFAEEIEAKLPVNSAEVRAFYEAHKNELPVQVSFDQVAPQIEGYLRQEKRQARYFAYLEELYVKHKVLLLIQKPIAPDIKPNPEGSPVLGNPNAKHTLWVFSDFQCPYCAKAHLVLMDLAKEIPDLKIVYRYYPLKMHAASRAAAVAAMCADQQGKFWPYATRLYKDQQNLKKELFLGFARAENLNLNQFETCFESPIVAQKVDKEIALAKEAGISMTPTFVLEGELWTGGISVGQVKKILKEARTD